MFAKTISGRWLSAGLLIILILTVGFISLKKEPVASEGAAVASAENCLAASPCSAQNSSSEPVMLFAAGLFGIGALGRRRLRGVKVNKTAESLADQTQVTTELIVEQSLLPEKTVTETVTVQGAFSCRK